MYALTIKVTKEILSRSSSCGLGEEDSDISENCAIALAIRDVFPKAFVGTLTLYPFGMDSKKEGDTFVTPYGSIYIKLPTEAIKFIVEFDLSSPTMRGMMKPIEFEIQIPDIAIGLIDITEVTKILEDHPTLELHGNS